MKERAERKDDSLHSGQDKKIIQSSGKKKISIGKNSKKKDYLWKRPFSYPSLPIISQKYVENGIGVSSHLKAGEGCAPTSGT